MQLYVTTVVRSAPPERGGELLCIDWDARRVVARTPIVADEPRLEDPNPRGNTRGGRGVLLLQDEVAACSYHDVQVFDRALAPRRRLTHGLFAGLHEVALERVDGAATLWLSATAIDAALGVDPATGAVTQSYWPREMPALAGRFGLEPLAIDKAADNRGRFLDERFQKHPSHVHLNAVAAWRGARYALLSKFGAIVDLDREKVVVEDRQLEGAHNLLVEDGLARVHDTVRCATLECDLETGRVVRRRELRDFPEVSAALRGADLVYAVRRKLATLRLHAGSPPRPGFVRGLARHGDSLFAGLSPAMIVRLDARDLALLDSVVLSRDVRVCVHGIAAK